MRCSGGYTAQDDGASVRSGTCEFENARTELCAQCASVSKRRKREEGKRGGRTSGCPGYEDVLALEGKELQGRDCWCLFHGWVRSTTGL